MMVADGEAAERVKLMFQMYAEPDISFGDITRHFAEQGIDFDGSDLQRSNLSYILRNPVYSQADLDIYEFFKAQGANIANDAADFSGTNGCYLFKGRDVQERKSTHLKDHILVVAPHEGLVSSETWLACRKKLVGNTSFGSTHKAKNTWLAGKVKCGVCGSGLMYAPSANRSGYFRCRKRADSKSCTGPGTFRALDVESFIYDLMCQKMTEFQTLTGGNPTKVNPKLTALNVELLQVEAEIEKLLDTLSGANATLLSYANTKIEELDTRRQGITKAIADLSAEAVSPEHMKRISNHLSDWDNADFEDRRLVADGLIAKISAVNEIIQIEWKI
jgi:uncharacterized protein YjbI with pentapeptide repeats